MRDDRNGVRSGRKAWLLAGASWAALACWTPASAADYTAGTEQQLRDAFAAAVASADATSTITLTGSFSVSATAISSEGKQITLITQGFTLSGTGNPSGTGGNIVIGPAVNASGILTISGTLVGGSGSTTGGTGLLRNSLSTSGTNTVVNTGSITGGTGGTTGGIGASLLNVEFLVNNGTVTGGSGASGGSGVQMSAGGTLTNNSGGLIQGGAGQTGSGGFGVFMAGSARSNTLDNSGTIRGGTTVTGTGGVGIRLQPVGTALQMITNTGVIEGGPGALAISGNAATRLTLVNSGTIRAGAGQDTAIAFGTNAVAVGTLELHPGSLIIGNVIVGNGSNDTLRLAGTGTAILDGGIGAGGQYQNFDIFEKTGSGTWILTGASTLTSAFQLQQGTLQIGNGGTAGSITGDIANAGTLVFSRSDTLTYAGVTSGSGVLHQAGSGTTILTGNNTYTGGTVISAGMLQIGAGGTTGSITGNVLNNGTLAFNRSDSVTFAGAISGSGGLRQDGAGTLILTADNSYTGGTSIATGTLQLGNGGTTGGIQGNVVNNGTLVVDRSGSLTLAGAISGIGALVVTGGGTVILTGENSYTGGTTITEGTLQIGNGGTTGSIIGNVLNNSPHTLAFNRSDTLVFSGVISGVGAVRQEGTGVTVLSGANTYSGATTVNAGTLRAGATGAFSSASSFTVAAGAALDLADISQTIAGLTNAGVVALRGAPGTTLTVAGNYVGQGGALALNTVLGGDGSASDRLVISGGTATGDTRIRLTNLGGSGAQTAEGIRVVQAANGGSTAAGAFRLDTRIAAGAFEYQLFRGGNASADDWYLRSFLLATPATPETPATPASPGIPLYRPEVALYAPIPAVGRQMGLATLGSLHARRGEELEIPATGALGKAGEGPASGAWARAFGERRRDRWDGNAEARATGNLIGIQAGFDILRTAPYAGGHRDVAGLYVAYADYNAPNVSGFAVGQQQRVGRLLMSGPAVGAYWTHFGPSGWYLDAVFQANWFDVSARSDFGAGLETNGTGYAASLEAGYPIRFGAHWQIEPQAQIVWQGVSVDRARDAFSTVDWDEGDAVTGRIGARLQYTGRDDRTIWQPYAKLNLRHAFSGSDRASFGGTPVTSRFGDTALEVGGGITARVSEAASFYAHADYRWAFDGDARGTAVQGTIGIRVVW